MRVLPWAGKCGHMSRDLMYSYAYIKEPTAVSVETHSGKEANTTSLMKDNSDVGFMKQDQTVPPFR